MKQRRYHLDLSLGSATHRVEVTHRSMKTLRLRVLPTGEIRLSAPSRCSLASVNAFLAAQTPWLADRLAEWERRYPASRSHFRLEEGGWLRVLGADYTLRIQQAERLSIRLEGTSCRILSPKAMEPAALARQFARWWRREALACYQASLSRYYPAFEKLGAPLPSLHVHRMTSRWGSCNYQKGRINLNTHLFATSQACVNYVMVHELAHLIHPRHDAAFYALVQSILPDWRGREAVLDGELIPVGPF